MFRYAFFRPRPRDVMGVGTGRRDQFVLRENDSMVLSENLRNQTQRDERSRLTGFSRFFFWGYGQYFGV
jgi:hypothetical protein